MHNMTASDTILSFRKIEIIFQEFLRYEYNLEKFIFQKTQNEAA